MSKIHRVEQSRMWKKHRVSWFSKVPLLALAVFCFFIGNDCNDLRGQGIYSWDHTTTSRFDNPFSWSRSGFPGVPGASDTALFGHDASVLVLRDEQTADMILDSSVFVYLNMLNGNNYRTGLYAGSGSSVRVDGGTLELDSLNSSDFVLSAFSNGNIDASSISSIGQSQLSSLHLHASTATFSDVATKAIDLAAGSSLNVNDLTLGDNVVANLDVNSSQLTVSGTTRLGLRAGGQFTGTVNDSELNHSDLLLGHSGQAGLTIEGGSQASGSVARIGVFGNGVGTATVTGANSVWNISQRLDIGDYDQSAGRLNIEDEARVVVDGDVVIGKQFGSSGSLIVSGQNSRLHANSIAVGGAGVATFTIRDKAFARAYDAVSVGNNGTLAIQDGGNLLTRDLVVQPGSNVTLGAGTLRILEGTFDTNGTGFAHQGDSNNESRFWMFLNSQVNVGEYSAGFRSSLLVYDYSEFTSTLSRLGIAGGRTSARVYRESTWNATEVLIGHSGQGQLTIERGSTFNTVNGRVGVFGGGEGSVRIDDSTWNSSSRIRIAEGIATTGSLDIQNGGVVNTPTMVIGHSVDSIGSATIDGLGSKLNITGVGMAVGNEGTGNLTITNGGAWESTHVNIGSFGGTGTVSLSDEGSFWNNSGLIRVGRADGAVGTLDIENDAQVSTSSIVIGDETGSTGNVRVANNGMIDATSLTVGNQGRGTLDIQGGKVTTDSMSIGDSGLVTFQSGYLTSTTIDLVGAAEFYFLGGTLSVESFAGSLVQNGGTLTPGDSPGSTIIDGDYTLNGGMAEIELGGIAAGTEHDSVSITGDMILDSAMLDVSLWNGFGLSENDEFLIFTIDGIRSGFFSGLVQDGLVGTYGGHRLWIDYLAGDGNDIRLYSTSVPEPSSLLMVGILGVVLCSRRRIKLSSI